MEASDLELVDFFGSVGGSSELSGGAADRFGPGRRSTLGLVWCRVVEALEGISDATGHGEISGAGFAVPVMGDAAAEGAGPVSGHLVLGCDDVEEVLGMFFAVVLLLDLKVVDNKAEDDGTRSVFERARGVLELVAAMLGNALHLGEAAHAFPDFHRDGTETEEGARNGAGVGICTLRGGAGGAGSGTGGL